MDEKRRNEPFFNCMEYPFCSEKYLHNDDTSMWSENSTIGKHIRKILPSVCNMQTQNEQLHAIKEINLINESPRKIEIITPSIEGLTTRTLVLKI